VWFGAAYLTATDTRGMSAFLLQRQLRLRRYETAWMLLHAPERSTDLPQRGHGVRVLEGTVEQYGTICGGTVKPLIIPANESCELDTEVDWQAVEGQWKAFDYGNAGLENK